MKSAFNFIQLCVNRLSRLPSIIWRPYEEKGRETERELEKSALKLKDKI